MRIESISLDLCIGNKASLVWVGQDHFFHRLKFLELIVDQTPILPSQTFSLAQDWHGISRKSLPGIACAYALAIAIRVSYDSSTAEASRYRHGIFSRIEPGRKPCDSRSTCHCHVDLSHRSAVENVAPKVAFAKQKQLAQKTLGSRERRTSRVCSGPVGGVAQGCN